MRLWCCGPRILERGRAPATPRLHAHAEDRNVFTVVFDTEHLAELPPPRCAALVGPLSQRSHPRGRQAWKPKRESLRPVGNDSGFLWRLHTYWRFAQTETCIIAEYRTITLTRSIPKNTPPATAAGPQRPTAPIAFVMSCGLRGEGRSRGRAHDRRRQGCPSFACIQWGLMLRRTAVLLVGAAILLTARQPNILLIVSDDQGYLDLGSMGSPDILTPQLDQLAAEGIRLTPLLRGPFQSVRRPAARCSQAASLSATAHTTIFRNDRVNGRLSLSGVRIRDQSGAHPRDGRARGVCSPKSWFAPATRPAFSESGILAPCAAFSPLQRGFGDFYGFVNTGIDYWTHERYGIPSIHRGNAPTREDKGVYATYVFERETLRFLEQNRDKPFFVLPLLQCAPRRFEPGSQDPWIRAGAWRISRQVPRSRPHRGRKTAQVHGGGDPAWDAFDRKRPSIISDGLRAS